MKILSCVFLYATVIAQADETTDRAVIAKVIAALNDGKARPDLQCDLLPAGAMSEVSPPHISTREVHFITPDVALVDAENTQYGSTIVVRRVPIVFVLKRQADEWKIAATRANCPLPPIPTKR